MKSVLINGSFFADEGASERTIVLITSNVWSLMKFFINTFICGPYNVQEITNNTYMSSNWKSEIWDCALFQNTFRSGSSI